MKKKIAETKKRPRLSVFRSNRAIYAQIIDDSLGKTLVAVSEKDLSPKVLEDLDQVTKVKKAGMIGEILAQKTLKKKIKKVVFDRGRCRYHGRVKALAEGARKGGLEF
jgi:large subunit ribosomal protein L18